MALYNDIESWKQILESQDVEKNEYDRACAESAAKAAELDKKEFEGIEEKEINPKSLGITETEIEDETEEIDEFDEEIDFSKYGIEEEKEDKNDDAKSIDEADHREPLTAIATALEKIVSTANLTGENSAKLNESNDNPISLEDAKKRVQTAIQKAGEDLLITVQHEQRALRGFDINVLSAGTLMFIEKNEPTYMFPQVFVKKIQDGGLKWRDVNSFVFDDGCPLADVRVSPKHSSPSLTFVFSDTRPKYGDFFDEGDSIDGMSKEQLDKMVEEALDAGAEAALDSLKAELEKNAELPLTDKDWKELDAEADPEKRIELLKQKVSAMDVPQEIKDDADKLIKQYNDQVIDRVVKKQQLHVPGGTAKGDEAAFRRAKALQKKSVEAFLASDQSQPGKGYGLTQDEEKEFVDIVKNKLDYDQLVDLMNDKAEVAVEMRPGDAKWNDGYAAGQAVGDDDDDDAGTEERRLAQDGFNQIFRVKDGGDDSKAYVGKEWDNTHYQPDPLIPKNGETAKYKLPIDTDAEGRWYSLPKGRKYVKDFLKSQTGKSILDYWMLSRDNDAPAGEWHGGKGAEAVDAAWDAVKGKKKGKSELGISDFIKVLNAIDPKVRDEMRQELAAGAVSAKEKEMIQKMFDGSISANELQKLGAEMGMGTDQGGKTGALTQQSDKMFYTLLGCLAIEMNVAVDEAEALLKAAAGGEKPENRAIRKEKYPVVMQELWDELDMPGEWHKNERADKNAFAMDVSKMLIKAWDTVLDGVEKAEMIEKYNAIRNGQKIVKFVTGLDREQNKRFQELVQKMREQGDKMTDREQTELLTLDYMRRKMEPVQARDKAVSDMERWGKKGGDEILRQMMKIFLRGGSGNANRISMKNRETEQN